MDARQKCILCGSQNEVGFVLDLGDKNRGHVEEWWAGKPERSFWTGMKKPERRLKVTTLRCTRCGYLMEFANPDEADRR